MQGQEAHKIEATHLVKHSRPGTLRLLNLGVTDYNRVWSLQKQLQRNLIDGYGEDTLIFCQHPAVITRGTSTKGESLLAPESDLQKLGIKVIDIERGGDITFHGPGQVVVYPIVDLKRHKKDVHWYMRSIEEVIIQSLAKFGISGERVPGRTGVWVMVEDELHKIASVGVRISRWCTLHGFSVNVTNQNKGFELINPCGLAGAKVTSLAELGRQAQPSDLITYLEKEFRKVFSFDI